MSVWNLYHIRKIYLHCKLYRTMMISDGNITYDEFLDNIHDIITTKSGNCPVTSLIQMLQGKWKFTIIYELCIRDPMRYGEIKSAIPGITGTMLSASLKELESDGLVVRRQFEEIPPRVEYSLSKKGRDLLPVFYEMMRWGCHYVD